jgi:hypothetical protein
MVDENRCNQSSGNVYSSLKSSREKTQHHDERTYFPEQLKRVDGRQRHQCHISSVCGHFGLFFPLNARRPFPALFFHARISQSTNTSSGFPSLNLFLLTFFRELPKKIEKLCIFYGSVFVELALLAGGKGRNEEGRDTKPPEEEG